jgi:hypothetical protein
VQQVGLETGPLDGDLVRGMISFHEGHLMVVFSFQLVGAVLVFLQFKRIVDEFDGDFYHGFEFQDNPGHHFFGGIRIPFIALSIFDNQTFPTVDNFSLVNSLL